MRCSVCQTVNIDHAVFCGGCGAPLAFGPQGAPVPPPPAAPLPVSVQSSTPTTVLPVTPLVTAEVVSSGSGRAAAGGQRFLLIGCAVVAVIALVVLAVVLLGGGDDPVPAASPSKRSVESSKSSAPADSRADGSTPDSSTTAPPTAPTATLVVATIALAPVTTTTPTTTPTTADPAFVAEGDLGLSIPISRPVCDGQYVTLIGASVDPANYATQVDMVLRQYPGSQYMKTELVCSSLRGQTGSGASIYAEFFGPYRTIGEACAARAFGPTDAYVKILDNVTANNAIVSC